MSAVSQSVSRPRFLKLSCAVQNYAWGKIGQDSKVAQLRSNGDDSFIIDNDQPYAELWMGVHSKAPSKIAYPPQLDGVTLGDWLSTNEWALGGLVTKLFKGQLPFLFKVLSINKALSIQAHPNMETAQILHSTTPDKYPDPNHKPEMVIALTDFKGLCGFRPLAEIKQFILNIPELKNVISSESVSCISNGASNNPTEAIGRCFKDLMHQDNNIIEQQLTKLIQSIKQPGSNSVSDILTIEEVQLLLRLYSWFPNDIGCFCLFFLNIVSLQPGQSMFLGPNIPHAYISGDIIECMANSDNVIRAGLTPKFRDKDTLCNILDYSPNPPSHQLFQSKPHPLVTDIAIYDPPTPEFAIAQIEINQNDNISIPVVNGPSILLIITGSGNITIEGSGAAIDGSEGVRYCQGEVLFVPAMNIINITPNQKTLIFQAYCEV